MFFCSLELNIFTEFTLDIHVHRILHDFSISHPKSVSFSYMLVNDLLSVNLTPLNGIFEISNLYLRNILLIFCQEIEPGESSNKISKLKYCPHHLHFSHIKTAVCGEFPIVIFLPS